MFSQTLEYALRAVVCLAQQDPKPLTTLHISALTHVPSGYLSKVLQSLGKAQIVSACRGIGGGYKLSIPPGQLTILQVVDAIDPLKRIDCCPLRLQSHGSDLCPLHHRMDRVLQDAQETFAATTIADLLNDPAHPMPLCETMLAAAAPMDEKKQ